MEHWRAGSRVPETALSTEITWSWDLRPLKESMKDHFM